MTRPRRRTARHDRIQQIARQQFAVTFAVVVGSDHEADVDFVIGERELLALGHEVGWDTLDRFAEAWLDYSEERMATAIRGLPAGHFVVLSGYDKVTRTVRIAS